MNIYQHALLKLFVVISFPEHFDVCTAKAKRPKPKRNRSIDEMLTRDRGSVVPEKRKKIIVPDAAEPIDSDLDLSDRNSAQSKYMYKCYLLCRLVLESYLCQDTYNKSEMHKSKLRLK